VSWRLLYTGQAQKDAKRLAAAGLRPNAQQLLDLRTEDPSRSPPPFDKLVGDLRGASMRRTTIQHRLVYQAFEDEHVVKMLKMWTHCE